eukprot:gene42095-51397_t
MASSHHDLNAQQRKTHEWLKHYLPVPLIEWPYVNSKSCPAFRSPQDTHSSRHGHLTSHLLSHFQIWSDWVFFDHDVREAVTRQPPEYVTSTSYSSISGHFRAYQNLTYTKNEVLLRDLDVLWVFEDTLLVDKLKVAVNVNASAATSEGGIANQLKDSIVMHVDSLSAHDLVQLFVCNSTEVKGAEQPQPSSQCPFVYAITRHGARMLTEEIELCGSRSLESQIQSLESWGILKVLKVHGNHAFEYIAHQHVGVP